MPISATLLVAVAVAVHKRYLLPKTKLLIGTVALDFPNVLKIDCIGKLTNA